MTWSGLICDICIISIAGSLCSEMGRPASAPAAHEDSPHDHESNECGNKPHPVPPHHQVKSREGDGEAQEIAPHHHNVRAGRVREPVDGPPEAPEIERAQAESHYERPDYFQNCRPRFHLPRPPTSMPV